MFLNSTIDIVLLVSELQKKLADMKQALLSSSNLTCHTENFQHYICTAFLAYLDHQMLEPQMLLEIPQGITL